MVAWSPGVAAGVDVGATGRAGSKLGAPPETGGVGRAGSGVAGVVPGLEGFHMEVVFLSSEGERIPGAYATRWGWAGFCSSRAKPLGLRFVHDTTLATVHCLWVSGQKRAGTIKPPGGFCA